MPAFPSTILILLPLPEKNGKTLHLLKANSKVTPAGRKRKHVAVLGTFADYQESKKKPAAPNQGAPVPSILKQGAGGSSIVSYMGPGPAGKNEAPGGKDAKMGHK